MSMGESVPDEQLIRTATYRLVDALDEVLDIDAGLTDATRSRLPRTVADALDGSLDVDAGLAQIMSRTRVAPVSDDTTQFLLKAKRSNAVMLRRNRRRRWLTRVSTGLLLAALVSAPFLLKESEVTLTIGVLSGFCAVLLIVSCITAEIVLTARGRREGVERTAGRVRRVRGPIRGQLESGVTAQCLEVTVEYYTRRGEGPFEVQRLIPLTSASSFAKNDRVIVSYDIRAPRRSRIAGRITHWPSSTTRLGIGLSFGPDTRD